MQQDYSGVAAAGGGFFALVYFAIIVLMIASMWRTFSKAGKPGWAAIVPIYNIIVLCEIVGRPVWWVVLFFVPVADFIALIVIDLDLAKSFGKGAGFAVGLILLPVIFYPMLGFGSAVYRGPSVAQPPAIAA